MQPMTSATVHRLHPNDSPRQEQKPDAADAFDVAGDNPDATPQGIVASILAQTANLMSSQGEREKTQRNAIVAFGVRCLSAGLLYLSQIVLARWMGGFQYGIYVFVWTWVLILGGLSHLGIYSIIYHRSRAGNVSAIITHRIIRNRILHHIHRCIPLSKIAGQQV